MKLPSVLSESVLRCVSQEDRKKLGKAGLTREDCEKRAQVKNERDLQRLIVSYLNLKGLEVRRDRMDKRTTGNVGWPDLTFAAKGIPIAWETKFGAGKLSEEQELTIAKLKKNGWRCCVIRSLEQAKSELWKICGI